ncbi:response regulator receiver domain-containing protein [Maribacter spongiicola]|uniref:Response regulator receiver domain-containing protein n=1 Tax=Maribacter spongiicola TaxID=1206753 RepID=A0A4R7JYS9_9FLAO|nr:response regulator [Maribacter spongiicola]TDT43680.1 response regulator receiver domain-containing protein [Maribacter spongiicola]
MEKLNIYIADDDLDDRDFFMEALNDISIKTEVSQFNNGVDLMDRLFSDDILPNVIFLDLYMPIMDGFECLIDIRNFKKFNNIYIIAYSSIYRDREVNQLKEDGANQFLKKSSSLKELKKILLKSLEQVPIKNKKVALRDEFVVLI